MTRLQKFQSVVYAVLTILVVSVVAGALNGHTEHYDCKYIISGKVLVQDHGKYDDAYYEVSYSDGTKGYTNAVGSLYNGDEWATGSSCQIIFQWGAPFSMTNRYVDAQSIVKPVEQTPKTKP